MRTLVLIAAIGFAFPAAADVVQLQNNAPQRHVVVKGDTLWDISKQFLKDPWKWPEVWQLNREQIKNPHLIYPGDVVVLTMENGQPRLSLEGPQFSETVKLSPQIRSEPIAVKEQGIPSIPLKAILPFLSLSAVGEPGELAQAPRILGSNDERVMFAKGDKAYASKGDDKVKDWNVVRLGQPLRNPDKPDEILAYELVHVGKAHTEIPGDPQLVRFTSNDQEILERDRLVPDTPINPPQYAPHAPAKQINAKVAAALGAQTLAGPWMSLVLNKGSDDGLEIGHVLALFSAGRSVADPKCLRADKIAFLAGGGHGYATDCEKNADDKTALPAQRNGVAFVYRVFPKVSYALVMESSAPVTVGDIARNP